MAEFSKQVELGLDATDQDYIEFQRSVNANVRGAARTLRRIQKPVSDYASYKEFVSDLYFVFWESTGNRLGSRIPASFKDVNDLRTDLEHDLDHGKPQKAASKRKKVSATFKKYASAGTPSTIDPGHLLVVQSNLLHALENDLRTTLVALS